MLGDDLPHGRRQRWRDRLQIARPSFHLDDLQRLDRRCADAVIDPVFIVVGMVVTEGF
jgi:hypothetical protein